MHIPQTYTHSDLTKIVANNVRDYGWHCVNVIEENGCPPWSYTIGLYETYGFPEVLLIGRSRATAHYIFTNLANRLEKNEPPDLTLPNIALLPGVLCLFRQVQRASYADFVGFALWFYKKREFPLQQFIWPNNDGKYPWDNDAPVTFKEWQPVLCGMKPD